MQYMVVYQLLVSLAVNSAFFMDGSWFSTHQVIKSNIYCKIGNYSNCNERLCCQAHDVVHHWVSLEMLIAAALHFAIGPALHVAIGPALHVAIGPALHFAIAPALHFAIGPVLLATSLLH